MVGRAESDLLGKRQPEDRASFGIVRQALAGRAVDQFVEVRNSAQGFPGDSARKRAVDRHEVGCARTRRVHSLATAENGVEHLQRGSTGWDALIAWHSGSRCSSWCHETPETSRSAGPSQHVATGPGTRTKSRPEPPVARSNGLIHPIWRLGEEGNRGRFLDRLGLGRPRQQRLKHQIDGAAPGDQRRDGLDDRHVDAALLGDPRKHRAP